MGVSFRISGYITNVVRIEMIVDTNHLPDWAIYVMIGGGILVLALAIWAIEYALSCLTCEPCRKCYHRLRVICYYLCCCCLFSDKQEIKYMPV